MQIETNKVRIIYDKTNPPRTDMIGREYKVCRSDYIYDDNFDMSTVLVMDDNQRYWLFYKSDVRFLTPIKFKDRHIAIGDKIKIKFFNDWYKVISFVEEEGKKFLLIRHVHNTIRFAEEYDIDDHDLGIETDDKIKTFEAEIEEIADMVSPNQLKDEIIHRSEEIVHKITKK